MDLSKILRSGDEVRVGFDGVNFITKVSDVTGAASFTVLRQADFPAARVGDIYSITCVTERGMYSFPAEVVGSGEVPAAIGLEATGEYVKLQRRETFRVWERLPVRIWELETAGEIAGEADWDEGVTVNISESGTLLRCRKKCEIGLRLRLVIRVNQLGMNFFLPAIHGKVVRCARVGDKDGEYLLGVKFERIPDMAKNEIMRFVVLSQRSRMGDPQFKRYRNYG